LFGIPASNIVIATRGMQSAERLRVGRFGACFGFGRVGFLVETASLSAIRTTFVTKYFIDLVRYRDLDPFIRRDPARGNPGSSSTNVGA
jgi:hypothetical protein